MSRTHNTLFLIESVDGKISTGDVDELDVDKDFKRIHGIKEGIHQYYDLEKTTDPYSLNSGRVMAKIGVNTRVAEPVKMGCSFIIIDNQPHLTSVGVEYLAKWVKTLFLVTSNNTHPVFSLKDKYPNIVIIYYEDKIDFTNMFTRLKSEHNIDKVTIQSGGSLNAEFLRAGLIDKVSIVLAPCLIGGASTQSLIAGDSIHSQSDLLKIRALTLEKCEVLENSFIHLTYVVNNTTIIDPSPV